MKTLTKVMLLAGFGILALSCNNNGRLVKSKVYTIQAEVNVPPNSQKTATAQCKDTDDVILTGLCQAPVHEVHFRAFGISNAAYNSQPTSKSGWSCTAYNPTDKTVINQARAACLEVAEE